MGRNIQAAATPLLLVFLVLASIQSVALSSGSISFIVNNSPVLDSREQSDLDMEVVGSGNTSRIFMSYLDYSAGISSPHVHFKRSMNGGSGWSNALDMLQNTSPGNKQLMPEMDSYTDENGTTIALVYMDSSFRPVSGLQEYVVICALSVDNGSTWERTFVTPMEDYRYPSDKIKNPSVKFGGEGSLFVVWEELTGDDRIHISYSLDRGANWSSPRKVSEPTLPENINSFQRYPDVAYDGHSVFVAWEGNPSFKIEAFISMARIPESPEDDLDFCDPIRIAFPIYYPMYWLSSPTIEAERDRVHLAWWDFSTDENGLDNQDLIRDRPCIKYTSSVDHGGNWSVGGCRNIKVNGTSPYIWHSRPSMDINNGTIAISWIDRNTSSSNVLVSYSTDNGLNWSSPLRANGYRSCAVHSGQKVAVDDGGYIHAGWMESVSGSDLDIYHTRTNTNTAPSPPANARTLVVEEHNAFLMWDINTEPDFDRYEVFISNFTLTYDERVWPEGELYERIRDQTRDRTVIDRGIEADTLYYWAVRVFDAGGKASVPSEGVFRTLPVNQPPVFVIDIEDIRMEEDNDLHSALNLSGLLLSGYVTDDAYMGFPGLSFDVETEKTNRNLSATVTFRSGSTYLDIKILRKHWHGTEKFRLAVRDTGCDGCPGTGDDLFSLSNWFNVTVEEVNDPPFWVSYTDLVSGWSTPLDPHQEGFKVPVGSSGCVEDMSYSFCIMGSDVDGDFIRFETPDPRFESEIDEVDPQHRSYFTFTPSNDDLPEVDIPLRMNDGRGSSRILQLRIPVLNVNDPPFFISVDGIGVHGEDTTVELLQEEGLPLSFLVQGADADQDDVLELMTSARFDNIRISEIAMGLWNVTLPPRWEGEDRSYSFDLMLLDRERTDIATLIVMVDLLRADPLLYLPVGWLDITFTYDLKDGELGDNRRIGAEWNEIITFSGTAVHSNCGPPLWSWEIKSGDNTTIMTLAGNPLSLVLLPSERGLGTVQEETFRVHLTVTGSGVQPMNSEFLITVSSDGDDDNDGLPDREELDFFGNLGHGPDEDEDGDGYTNLMELINPLGAPTDPLDKRSYPGAIGDGDDDNPRNHDRSKAVLDPLVASILISAAVFTSILVAGVLLILRREKRKGIAEEEEIEEKVNEMEKKQKEINGLYGIQRTEESFGPDQSTLDDLDIDLGGEVYHGSEMIKAYCSGGHRGGEIPGGPLMQEDSVGPLFKETLELEGITP